MRLRFSLRALFLLTTVVSAVCLWLLLPTLTAKRFLAAIAKEDYPSADAMFESSDGQTLADASDKRWGFRTSADLQPLTVSQLLCNQREVTLNVNYFQFDQNLSVQVRIKATPFGLNKLEVSPVRQIGVLYDKRSGSAID